jgi:diguanylate cyclase (GGDEF)-like protein
VCVIVYDIDNFKQVNDLYGHDVGDQVLIATAHVLAADPGVSVYRLGGEEFAVVLPGGEASAGGRLAERHRRAVEAAVPAGLRVTVSAGVAAGRGARGSLGPRVPACGRGTPRRQAGRAEPGRCGR